jgi:hypothetical protein
MNTKASVAFAAVASFVVGLGCAATTATTSLVPENCSIRL